MSWFTTLGPLSPKVQDLWDWTKRCRDFSGISGEGKGGFWEGLIKKSPPKNITRGSEFFGRGSCQVSRETHVFLAWRNLQIFGRSWPRVVILMTMKQFFFVGKLPDSRWFTEAWDTMFLVKIHCCQKSSMASSCRFYKLFISANFIKTKQPYPTCAGKVFPKNVTLPLRQKYSKARGFVNDGHLPTCLTCPSNLKFDYPMITRLTWGGAQESDDLHKALLSPKKSTRWAPTSLELHL